MATFRFGGWGLTHWAELDLCQEFPCSQTPAIVSLMNSPNANQAAKVQGGWGGV